MHTIHTVGRFQWQILDIPPERFVSAGLTINDERNTG